MTTRELALMYAGQGYTARVIAEKIGVSQQRVYQIIGKTDKRRFRTIGETECIYPNIRNWMNENRVSRRELRKLMGLDNDSGNATRIRRILCGAWEPRKLWIDRLIAATGMKYEELFVKEEVRE